MTEQKQVNMYMLVTMAWDHFPHIRRHQNGRKGHIEVRDGRVK